jgi:hypothetical protein
LPRSSSTKPASTIGITPPLVVMKLLVILVAAALVSRTAAFAALSILGLWPLLLIRQRRTALVAGAAIVVSAALVRVVLLTRSEDAPGVAIAWVVAAFAIGMTAAWRDAR